MKKVTMQVLRNIIKDAINHKNANAAATKIFILVQGGSKKPVSEILNSRADLKKMFAVYVQEGYEGVGFEQFTKLLDKEGFEEMKSAARIVHAIENLGYSFTD